MRSKPGFPDPQTLHEYYERASDLSVYGDSGICRHLPYFRFIRHGFRPVIVELGTGGGDQSTIAWLAGGPAALHCYDLNIPAEIDALTRLAQENDIEFVFHQGNTRTVEPVIYGDFLFVDSLHDAPTVEAELARFVGPNTRVILFHDIVSFGRVGQSSGPNQGINLAIADFLFTHPEWRVAHYTTEDNGLLVLCRHE